MPTIIKGQPTSEDVRRYLADRNEPVILACSLGKDSLAAWTALENDGVKVHPVYFWSVPDLPLIEENVEQIENIFETKINLAPHPRFFRMLSKFVLQPPQRLSTIQYTGIDALDYDDMWPQLKEDLGLPKDTFICDGVRACDSIPRRASLTKHGVLKKTTHKASVIADWQKNEVMEALEKRGIGLPPDYEMFGRSFDGFDKRFMEPLKENRPQDFEIIKKWFPFVEADICRWHHFNMKTENKNGQEYQQRAKNETERYKLAVNSNYWLCFSFTSQKGKEAFDSLFKESENDYLFADTFEVEPLSTRQRKARPRPIRLNEPPYDLIDGLRESDGTLNDSALALAENLMKAFSKVDSEKSDTVFGSNIYSVVIFRDEKSLKQFTSDYHAGNVENPYIDGDNFLKKINL